MAVQREQLWKSRLEVPAYLVGEAARYARTSSQTVNNWQRIREDGARVIAPREAGAPVSYLQLIEIGVVAAMREAGVTLKRIREARDYLSKQFQSRYPFAEYRFMTDGKKLFLDYAEVAAPKDSDKLLSLNESGQLAWRQILSQRLREFDYGPNRDSIVLRWKVAGLDSPIEIDPRIAFGAPHVNGVPTWVIRDRWASGENVKDIADDYDLEPSSVSESLKFEGIEVDLERPRQWAH